MTTQKDIEALVTHHLSMRGLARVPGPQLAFSWQGQPVMVSIDQSPYTGFFLTVHDRGRPLRQFRAHAGEYEWSQVAAIIAEIAASRLQHRRPSTSPEGVRENNRHLADELAAITGAGPSSRLSIEPSSSAPGRVRVKLSEVELDPPSVMQLFAAVSHALPTAKR